MNRLRLFLVAAWLGVSSLAQAQISAFINGKPIKPGATINKDDLPSLEVSFKNPKKPSFIYGKLSFVIELVNDKNIADGYWYIRKDGSAAIEDFLDNTPATKKFKVFDKNVMVAGDNDLDWLYKFAVGKDKSKNMKLQISLLYREETGYQKYGQPIELLESLNFNVPIWDERKMYLHYLDLNIDKTNIADEINLKQRGRLGDEKTIWGYWMRDKNGHKYSMYAVSSDQFSGMNTEELAKDFIHAAAYYASQDFVTKFSNYDIEKYTIDWDEINDLLTERRRIPSLSWKNNKEIKKMDLLTLMQPVEINGLKGYTFKAAEEARIDRSTPWKSLGQFVIYILNHPTNPKLTLVFSTSMYNDATSTEGHDMYIKKLINSIKK